MSNFFITSSGTEIGKTFVTASLTWQLRQAGHKVSAVKPVISGVTDDTMTGSDTSIIAAALGLEDNIAAWDTISPIRYQAPLAPSMAAKLEGRSLDYEELLAISRNAMAQDGVSLIEGVGGSFVPLCDGKLVADWIADLEIPSILVTGSYLGAMSHTIATLEAMSARGLETTGIVISESPGDNPDFAETCAQIADITGLQVIAVSRLSGERAWTRAPDLTRLITSQA